MRGEDNGYRKTDRGKEHPMLPRRKERKKNVENGGGHDSDWTEESGTAERVMMVAV